MSENTTDTNAKLRGYISELDSLDDELGLLREDRKAIMARVKEEGFNVKAVKLLLKRLREERKGSRTFDVAEAYHAAVATARP